MITYEDASQMLEGILNEVPDELFRELSGGVILAEESKLHTRSRPERPLYIMGEYRCDTTGRCIVIYYGSFRIVYGCFGWDAFREKLRHTFSHELRHHIERMAGVSSLNKFDDDRLEMYISGLDTVDFKEPPIA